MKKFWTLGALLVACAGENPVNSDDNSPGNIRSRGGKQPHEDGGLLVVDGGLPVDAGIQPSDAGGSLSDASPVSDGNTDQDANTGVNYPRTGTWAVTLTFVSHTNPACGNQPTVSDVWTVENDGRSITGSKVTLAGTNGVLTETVEGGLVTVKPTVQNGVLSGTYTMVLRYGWNGGTAPACELVRSIQGELE